MESREEKLKGNKFLTHISYKIWCMLICVFFNVTTDVNGILKSVIVSTTVRV